MHMPMFRSGYKRKPAYVRNLKTRRSGIVVPRKAGHVLLCGNGNQKLGRTPSSTPKIELRTLILHIPSAFGR